MPDCPTHYKFPEGSANRSYVIIELLPDGSGVWRDYVFGMNDVELKMQELARESNNKFFALSLQGRIDPAIRPLKSTE
jgi:hypothetical protein